MRYWENNKIQFPRLIAELEAAGAIQNAMGDLKNSMDLSEDEILELVERASNEWDKIRRKL